MQQSENLTFKAKSIQDEKSDHPPADELALVKNPLFSPASIAPGVYTHTQFMQNEI